MTPNNDGRFCSKCSKTVIDFTDWSDERLYLFFEGNKADVCGRLHVSQLNRVINIPPQPHSRLYRIAVAMGLTLLFTNSIDAQTTNKPPLVTQSAADIKTKDDRYYNLLGFVTNSKWEPVENAQVIVKQGGLIVAGTNTDFDGHYKISNLEPGLYDLEIKSDSFTYYKMTGIVISPGEKTGVNARLSKSTTKDQIVITYQKPTVEGATISRNVMRYPEIKQKPTTQTLDIADIEIAKRQKPLKDGHGNRKPALGSDVTQIPQLEQNIDNWASEHQYKEHDGIVIDSSRINHIPH